MEDTLLSKLTVAQGIIKDSDKHYDIADAAEQELQRTTKKYNHRMIAVVIIGLLVYILIPDDNFIISWLFKLIAIGAFGFALYYFYQEKDTKVKELIDQIKSERQTGKLASIEKIDAANATINLMDLINRL